MKKVKLTVLLFFYFAVGYTQYSHQWTKTIGDTNNNYGPYSIIDSSGNTIMFIRTFTDFDVDPDTSSTISMGLFNIANHENYVLFKYDTSGNYLWHSVFSLYNTSVVYSIKTDLAGNIFIVGYFSHNAIIQNGIGGNDTITSSNNGNSLNVLVLKYSPSGTLVFAKHLETTGVSPTKITVKPNGDFFLYGYFYGNIDFDPGPGLAIVNSFIAAFFAKYDSNGQLLFYKVLYPISTSSVDIVDLHLDYSGNIVTTGWVDGSADLGGGTVGSGQYFAKYDSAGNYLFHKLITGDLNFINSLGIDRQNNIFLSGFIRTTPVDINPGPGVYIIQPNGPNEALLAKYDSLGNFVWGHGFGGINGDQCGSFDIDTSGNIYVSAGFSNNMLGNPSFGLPSTTAGSVLIKFDSNGYVISLNSLTNWAASNLSIYRNEYLLIQGGFNFSADFDLSTGIFSKTSNGGSDLLISKYLLKNEHFLISGKVYSDLNNDSIFNAGDTPLQNVIVSVNPGNYYASTNSNGDYYCYVPQGNYTISVPVMPPHFMNSFPVSDTATFLPLTQQVDTANNFALLPEPNALDLKINLTNLGPLRPGFVSGFILSASNIGTVALAPDVTLDYPNNVIYFSSYPVADSIAPYFLKWNMDTLFPTHSENLFSEFIVIGNLGDTVTTECRIYPDTNDLNPSNNKDKQHFIVQGSWDPNYKEVSPSGDLLPAQADTTLLAYTVHFQNTGTDTAFTVIIVDTLSTLLNISTFVLEAASHPCSFTISGNGIIEFTFRNILLPDSGTNFVRSCGFVKYSIRPLVGLTNGQVIENSAHIVFDFNVPVSTNLVQTLIGVTGISNSADTQKTIQLFPNPTSDFLTITNTENKTPSTIFIKDVCGKIVLRKNAEGTKTIMDLRKLSSGIYFVDIKSENKHSVSKIIKVE